MQLGIRCRIRCRRFFRTFCSDVRNFCRAWPAWKELMPGSQTGHELLRPLGERSNWHLLKCGSDPKSTLNSDFCTLYFIFSYLYCTLGLSENWIYSPKWPVQRRSIMGSGYPGLEMDEIFDVLQCCLKIVYSRCRTSHAEKNTLVNLSHVSSVYQISLLFQVYVDIINTNQH